MTLPALIQKQQKTVLVTRLKKTYTVLNQQIMRAQLDNGPYDTWPKGGNIVVEEYFNTYFKPYFNGVQLCETAISCGYKSKYPWKNLSGKTLGWSIESSTTRTLFQLNNGTTVFMPRNTTDAQGRPSYYGSGMVYVDINGTQSPNILGRDVFLFQIDTKKGILPLCYEKDENYINSNCNMNSTGNENCCTAKIISDGWEIRDDYPW